MMQAPYLGGKLFTEYRYKHCLAMQSALQKIDYIDKEFQKSFGRSYGGLIEEYRNNDAEIVLVALGSAASTAKTVIDVKRDEGVKVGLVRIRCFRPFAGDRLGKALKGARVIGVIDRDVCFGWNTGIVFMELRSLLNRMRMNQPMVNFIAGLSGADITKDHIDRAINNMQRALHGEFGREVTWLDLE